MEFYYYSGGQDMEFMNQAIWNKSGHFESILWKGNNEVVGTIDKTVWFPFKLFEDNID